MIYFQIGDIAPIRGGVLISGDKKKSNHFYPAFAITFPSISMCGTPRLIGQDDQKTFWQYGR